ncbi:N-formylglutamate deformylase [Agarivorans sp. QJM3NY_25]|uniref:N-formylglutamate deformylase n=1 Tax=Agarivorans sp. QJM3NY_25 TaxID=3421430 RepID=UPI003D7D73A9
MFKCEKPFQFHQGNNPLLVSMPHSGLQLLPGMQARLSESARHLPDTDWYLPQLYEFLSELDVSIISANYSRYVVDLNRPQDDQALYASKTTGLFPEILFDERPVFLTDKQHSAALKAQIKTEIWQPYHQQIASELARLKAQFGYAILFDAHSIAAQVPMLFAGKLPDFNFGNNDGLACAPDLLTDLENIVASSHYSHVCNGRFKGGYITRHFGQPQHNIHAIQLELSQDTYLADSSKTYQLDSGKIEPLKPLLQQLISCLLAPGKAAYLKNTNEV